MRKEEAVIVGREDLQKQYENYSTEHIELNYLNVPGGELHKANLVVFIDELPPSSPHAFDTKILKSRWGNTGVVKH
jgi:hypothetical protein